MRFIFRAFVRELCHIIDAHYCVPLVIFLDDAEWIDATSANLLSSLGNDVELGNLLVIVSVRSEMYHADDENHHLLRSTFQAIQDIGMIRCSEIVLENLTQDQVHELVANSLRMQSTDPDSVKPLSDLIYQRTLGNCFFAVQFLRNLIERRYLQFNFNTFSWTWDIDQLQVETNIADNVFDLVSSKLKTLSEDARHILSLASCLHTTIELDVLTKIVVDYPLKTKRAGLLVTLTLFQGQLTVHP